MNLVEIDDMDLCTLTNVEAVASFEVTLKAKFLIDAVIVIPARSIDLTAYSENISVYVVNDGVEQLCGTIYSALYGPEVKCGFLGNQVILRKTSSALGLCSLGILTPKCDCSITSFEQTWMPNYLQPEPTKLNLETTV